MIKPSPKRESETAGEYVERLDWEKNRLPKDVLERPVTGVVATAEGFKRWSDSWRVGTPTGGKLNPKHSQQFTFDPIPDPKKTDPTVKLERLTKMLIDQAAADYKATGRISFSRSVLRRLSMLTGLTEQQLEAQTLDSLRSVYASYAGRLLLEAEQKGSK